MIRNSEPVRKWYLDTTYEERKGTRRIYNIAMPLPENGELPSIEAVEGCEMFTCQLNQTVND